MTASNNSEHTSIDDTWVYFWSEYMIWTLRVCCYCSNLYFFSVMRGSLQSLTGSSYALEFVIAIYSVAGFLISERIFKIVYRPRFFSEAQAAEMESLVEGALVLNSEEYKYRQAGELVIGSAVLFAVFNLILAVILNVTMGGGNSNPIAFGALAGFLSIIFTLFGVAGLVGEGPSGKRSIFAQALGFLFLLLPAAFILHTFGQFGAI